MSDIESFNNNYSSFSQKGKNPVDISHNFRGSDPTEKYISNDQRYPLNSDTKSGSNMDYEQSHGKQRPYGYQAQLNESQLPSSKYDDSNRNKYKNQSYISSSNTKNSQLINQSDTLSPPRFQTKHFNDLNQIGQEVPIQKVESAKRGDSPDFRFSDQDQHLQANHSKRTSNVLSSFLGSGSLDYSNIQIQNPMNANKQFKANEYNRPQINNYSEVQQTHNNNFNGAKIIKPYVQESVSLEPTPNISQYNNYRMEQLDSQTATGENDYQIGNRLLKDQYQKSQNFIGSNRINVEDFSNNPSQNQTMRSSQYVEDRIQKPQQFTLASIEGSSQDFQVKSRLMENELTDLRYKINQLESKLNNHSLQSQSQISSNRDFNNAVDIYAEKNRDSSLKQHPDSLQNSVKRNLNQDYIQSSSLRNMLQQQDTAQPKKQNQSKITEQQNESESDTDLIEKPLKIEEMYEKPKYQQKQNKVQKQKIKPILRNKTSSLRRRDSPHIANESQRQGSAYSTDRNGMNSTSRENRIKPAKPQHTKSRDIDRQGGGSIQNNNKLTNTIQSVHYDDQDIDQQSEGRSRPLRQIRQKSLSQKQIRSKSKTKLQESKLNRSLKRSKTPKNRNSRNTGQNRVQSFASKQSKLQQSNINDKGVLNKEKKPAIKTKKIDHKESKHSQSNQLPNELADSQSQEQIKKLQAKLQKMKKKLQEKDEYIDEILKENDELQELLEEKEKVIKKQKKLLKKAEKQNGKHRTNSISERDLEEDRYYKKRYD
ncbi:UNKNOWN [Stylonychia lemnae]|uniref:Uncharacterized protein n=1 Tax=Stylonychia lemnae TaxID=5949 RepID=A0A078B5S1_STYLE|nr:UNKNOWN [Stylonychia lemnae]|eukprot:CDW89556.1 UNKNOWN [Stylonychia lemnae]